MREEELIIGFFEKGYCCDLNEVKETCLGLLKENQELKDNWNKLKEYLNTVDTVIDYSENYVGHYMNYDELINKIQELEQGSDSSDSNE